MIAVASLLRRDSGWWGCVGGVSRKETTLSDTSGAARLRFRVGRASVTRRLDRDNGKRRIDGERAAFDRGEPLPPALEAFAQTVADILVERHLERKRLKTKTHGEPTVKTPGDLSRREREEG